MIGNPCTENDDYKSYLIAFVPQLVYYGYKIISDQEKKDAIAKYS